MPRLNLPAILAASLVMSAPALAEPHIAPPCPTLAESRLAATEQVADEGTVTHLDGAEARRFLQALDLNSRISSVHISVMVLPGRAMVILDDGQCGGLKSAIIVPPGLAQAAFELALVERT